LLVVVAAANQFSATMFGDFSFGYATIFFVLGLSRAFASEPVLGRGWQQGVDTRRDLILASRSVAIHALAAGLVIAFALDDANSAPILVAGALLVFIHDHLRHVAYARAHPVVPLAADLTWAAGTVVILLRPSPGSPISLLFLWLIAAGPACVVSGVLLIRLRQTSESPHSQLTTDSNGRTGLTRSGVRLWFEYLLTMGVSYFGIIVLRSFDRSGAVGAIRGALTLLAPVSLLLATFLSAVVPALARQSQQHLSNLPSWAWGKAAQVSLLLAATSLLLGTAWLLLPRTLGRTLLGESWGPASSLLPLMTFAIALGSLSNGPLVIMRALSLSASSLRTRLTSSSVGLPIVAVGSAVGGAVGYCIGSIAAGVVSTAIWWMSLRRQVFNGRDEPASPALKLS